MKVLIDINHPAHVHFFRNPAALLEADGHEVIFTSRNKDVTLDLLKQYGLRHQTLSEEGKGGLIALVKELLYRNYALYKVVKKEKPDIMASIGGTFIAHVGFATRTPAIVFYDTENAKLQNLITYPLANCVVVPVAYQAWLPKQHRRYPGYHELSYLHPNYFTPDKSVAIENGLDPDRGNILIRMVAWKANHDLGEVGWSRELLREIIKRYSEKMNILISSEQSLGQEFDTYLYKGNVACIHHVLAFCRLFIGESATMASESAVLGVPAIYAANTGRGYTDEQEEKYGLVRNIRALDADSLIKTIDDVLSEDLSLIRRRRENLLSTTIDVANYVKDFLISWKNK
jgi:predicted glycosyltransferase